MGNRYKFARQAAHMTQEHLATAAMVSVSTIRRLETGQSVGAESRRSVAAVLNVDVCDPPTERRPDFPAGTGAHVVWHLVVVGVVFLFVLAFGRDAIRAPVLPSTVSLMAVFVPVVGVLALANGAFGFLAGAVVVLDSYAAVVLYRVAFGRTMYVDGRTKRLGGLWRTRPAYVAAPAPST